MLPHTGSKVNDRVCPRCGKRLLRSRKPVDTIGPDVGKVMEVDSLKCPSCGDVSRDITAWVRETINVDESINIAGSDSRTT